MMDWELGYGGWLACSHPHVPASPFAPLWSPDPALSHLCLICKRTIELFLWLLVWNESVQGQTLRSRKGRGVGIWQPAAGWDCHGATEQPWWLHQGHTSGCQQETETSLVLHRVLTTGLSNAVTGRKWLYIYSTWIYCLFANTDVWINSCFLVCTFY